jgi:hypothetical protein
VDYFVPMMAQRQFHQKRLHPNTALRRNLTAHRYFSQQQRLQLRLHLNLKWLAARFHLHRFRIVFHHYRPNNEQRR